MCCSSQHLFCVAQGPRKCDFKMAFHTLEPFPVHIHENGAACGAFGRPSKEVMVWISTAICPPSSVSGSGGLPKICSHFWSSFCGETGVGNECRGQRRCSGRASGLLGGRGRSSPLLHLGDLFQPSPLFLTFSHSV